LGSWGDILAFCNPIKEIATESGILVKNKIEKQNFLL